MLTASWLDSIAKHHPPAEKETGAIVTLQAAHDSALSVNCRRWTFRSATRSSRVRCNGMLRGTVPASRLIKQALKDALGNPHDTLILAGPDAELDGRSLGVPPRIRGKAKEHATDIR